MIINEYKMLIAHTYEVDLKVFRFEMFKVALIFISRYLNFNYTSSLLKTLKA